MKSKHFRHFQSKNDIKCTLRKNLIFFRRKNTKYSGYCIGRPPVCGGETNTHRKVVRVSFFFAWTVPRAKLYRSAVLRLNKLAAVEMATMLCSDTASNKSAADPLWKDTIKRWIQEILDDVLRQTIAVIKRSESFSSQSNQKTTKEKYVQLIVFLRFQAMKDYLE